MQHWQIRNPKTRVHCTTKRILENHTYHNYSTLLEALLRRYASDLSYYTLPNAVYIVRFLCGLNVQDVEGTTDGFAGPSTPVGGGGGGGGCLLDHGWFCSFLNVASVQWVYKSYKNEILR